MEMQAIINSVVQNGFLTVFGSTVLFFMIRIGNIYVEKFSKHNGKLSDSITMNLVRSVVWYHSRGKIRNIEGILIENNIEKRKDEITRKVRNSLEERTMVYLDYFNTLDTSIQRLGDFYGKTFEMEAFFKEVMDVVLRPYEGVIHDNEISTKLKDISEIMFFYQDKANIKLEAELHRINNSL